MQCDLGCDQARGARGGAQFRCGDSWQTFGRDERIEREGCSKQKEAKIQSPELREFVEHLSNSIFYSGKSPEYEILYKGQCHNSEGGFPDVLSFQKSPKYHSPQEREEQNLFPLPEFLGLGKPLPTH